MLFYSTGGKTAPTTFRHAVLGGLAPDGGLWMPTALPRLPGPFFERLPGLSLQEIGFEVASQFVEGGIPAGDLRDIIEDAIDFSAPLVPLSENMFVLELFHGPTLSFKDFGARFLARLTSHFLRESDRDALVLVATSGDTGSAVAHAFYRMSSIRVLLLYPSGKVSEIQEKQMTTLGENVTAVEVSGTFDDCQRLVKQAFGDEDISLRLHLLSANSINIARLIPQSFYYLYAYGHLPASTPVVFSVPSGNFGNLTAGIFAKRMGLPVQRLIAATNANDVVPRYLSSGTFTPRPSLRTLSNAMDVGNPSNFARMMALYNSDVERMKKDISAYGFTDEETRFAMREIYQNHGYVCDPHSAVAYLGLKMFQNTERAHGIFLATAHPAKFRNVVDLEVEIPSRLKECLNKPKKSIRMENDFARLKDFLL